MSEHNYRTTISLRMKVNTIAELDAMCHNSKMRLPNVEKIFKDRTECIETLIGTGLFIQRNKATMSDPKFVEQLNDMIKNEKYLEWLYNLSDVQKVALRDLINQSLEGKQVKII